MNKPVQEPIKQQRPYFLILLPIFFVLHGCLENFGFISFKDSLTLTASYLIMSLLIYLFSFLFFKNRTRAALIATLWMAVFFFFGALHDFLRENSSVKFFSRYSILLPVVLLFLVWLFIFLKKTPKRFSRFTIFLNTLLVIYIVIDGIMILTKEFQSRSNTLSVYNFEKDQKFIRCDTCNRPDIYFLLFDEYAGSTTLKRKYNYDNKIDTFFASKGFAVQSESRSNYNFTVASMAAIFNLKYVTIIKDANAVTAEDYGNCDLLIRNNSVIRFLDVQGYQIHNFSIFNMAGHPSMGTQTLLPLQTKLITERTLFARLNKDMGWILRVTYPFNRFVKNNLFKTLKNDQLFMNLVKEESKKKQKQPRFIYAHLNMPHPPFFFDKNLHVKDDQSIMEEFKSIPTSAYLDYLNYTNAQLQDLVNTILGNNPSAVIVIMGDHGFRTPLETGSHDHLFKTMNAVYFPDRDYKTLYDSISGVNQFRVIFNKIWHQNFPLLRDSVTYLRDKN